MLHGSFSYVMQDEDGQTCDVHSISAGLDYPGVGPEHSYWKDTGRVTYTSCRDDEALDGLRRAGPQRRDFAGARKLARRRQGAWKIAAHALARTRSSSSASPAAATKTPPKSRGSRERAGIESTSLCIPHDDRG